MNKNRVQQKRVATGLLLGLSITMALVIVDRDLFRSGTSSVTIMRSVPGSASTRIIQAIEEFNSSKGLNWSNIGLDVMI